MGLKQGAEELKRHVYPDLYSRLGTTFPVDNYYLSLMLEAGLVGFAIWMAMFILILIEGVGSAGMLHGLAWSGDPAAAEETELM